jgi:hypothetical protein
MTPPVSRAVIRISFTVAPRSFDAPRFLGGDTERRLEDCFTGSTANVWMV